MKFLPAERACLCVQEKRLGDRKGVKTVSPAIRVVLVVCGGCVVGGFLLPTLPFFSSHTLPFFSYWYIYSSFDSKRRRRWCVEWGEGGDDAINQNRQQDLPDSKFLAAALRSLLLQKVIDGGRSKMYFNLCTSNGRTWERRRGEG